MGKKFAEVSRGTFSPYKEQDHVGDSATEEEVARTPRGARADQPAHTREQVHEVVQHRYPEQVKQLGTGTGGRKAKLREVR